MKIKRYTKKKLPHFFIYAKGKNKNNVELINDSTVNKIRKYIPTQKLRFNICGLGKFDYKVLMQSNPVHNELYNTITEKYQELAKNINMFVSIDDGTHNNYNYLFKKITADLLTLCPDKYLLTDILVDYLFNVKNSKCKVVFWNCFGDIVFENLTINVENNRIYCRKCGRRFRRKHFNERFCKACKSYKSASKKRFVCIDCASEFASSSKRQSRCRACYKKYRNEYQKKINAKA